MTARREALEDPRCEVHLLGALLAGEIEEGPHADCYVVAAHRSIAAAIATIAACGDRPTACAVDLELARVNGREARDVLLEVMSAAMPHPVPSRLAQRVQDLARKRAAVDALRAMYVALTADNWLEARKNAVLLDSLTSSLATCKG